MVASPKVQSLAHFVFLIYINDLTAAFGKSAFLYADDVKMVAFYPRFLSPGPGQRNMTYQSTPTNVQASPSGT